MKNKILIGIGIALCATLGWVFAGPYGAGYTGAPSPITITATLTANTPVILLTNNVQVVNVQASVPSGSGMVYIYDHNNAAAPYYGTNWVSSAYVAQVQYPTNFVTTYVGYNGYTNYYTNVGLWTATITNAAATNALSPQATLPVYASMINQLTTPVMCNLGISVVATVNCSVVISYIPNR
jgi:hypothetical protein